MFRNVLIIMCCALIFSCERYEEPAVEKSKEQQSKVSEVGSMTVEDELAVKSNGYIPFPDGYGYMQDLKLLQKATDEGNRDYIRQHAWALFAGIMQPSKELGWPLWYSWPNTHGAFQDSNPQPVGEKVRAKTRKSHSTIIQNNLANAPDVDTKAPIYDIPEAVSKQYPDAICHDKKGNPTICDGPHFVNNGDILIPTESLSMTAMKEIRNDKLYLQSTLDKKHADKVTMLDLDKKWIVTKHMYWPVKAEGLTGIPVWKNNFPVTFTGYAGYEYWDTMVAVDPSGTQVGQTADVSFLYGVKDNSGNPIPTVSTEAQVYGLDSFYFHQITQDDWDSFSDADKAILSAASYWANGQSIGVGDYLVTIAMHVNTKELKSWTMQSVWWSDKPNEGQYAGNRPQLPQAQGPWQHYLLTDSYAVPANLDGKVDIAVNPYIEGVIHPIATSCRNCHVRAGWPTGKVAGTASYQNPDCPGLLDDITPGSDCLKGLTLTDYLWIIPDRAVDDTVSK
ncbi:hypothetical protein [Kangiella sediminilitoris]|uniref:Lipoprotein n=1 Tax=Kangiella sediminilitoris TaxID=1144748 RepID=A0A1B3B9Z3_9GAMM|nr:hypothetical protein [Kangiella sediminilitoris]AOE49595.1 hypothetical protein KS2013_873 [Kangiella sediminilitoris]